uniref:Uncharacterized protein n=1 Tax=Haptolina ericina TaxID=156174 RepID=A0A7S3AGX2_9EUKA|mmetsp:Transcript_16101/g.36080  ORF Transcript_16101/g.36080 Transcript_16101/m.36080 type:complete len:233 (+) Transcript_16101:163-861(+)|eukprot:CAMPEP_0181198510 /NCGR_PEP_ID=MMETSP1096-20121128/16662_1 /TAXON_ID=156174 ORGANISM="Chrysochromulina ericina, Strain CCMP281" /NCGR_SAMPLE_ID=MMETSP1096 /ASSEMBLY_ACC=CAM_ASM_000453 /LENGTH=232 /DNA_ID=CAMNT_0023288591 /DNA_START=93 /DNA_END=791 /DNA_ORIENTATION=-
MSQQASMPAKAATVKARFQQGDFWVWLYRDAAGDPSSWERYAVRASAGEEVLIDMQTKFNEADAFHTHHRIRLSLSENLVATESHRQWALREFAFCQEGFWRKAPHRDNVQAFEEKFDIFLMAPNLPPQVSILRQREQDISALGRTTLIQGRRHAYTGSWYVREPQRHVGVAALKHFGPVGGPDTYTFELVGVGNGVGTDDAGAMSTEAGGCSSFDRAQEDSVSYRGSCALR